MSDGIDGGFILGESITILVNDIFCGGQRALDALFKPFVNADFYLHFGSFADVRFLTRFLASHAI